MAPYRPPGRSNRSGRTNADNDVFEGLPVKQWGQSYSRVSLVAPQAELEAAKDDKWGEPPMPRDYQLLAPWTQHLLKLARSGKVGTKRKQEPDLDEDKPDDEIVEEEANKTTNLPEERGYVAKKWKPIPEHALEPEHKHFNFLAKRRRGLPNLYGPDQGIAPVALRKTKVQKTDANGEVSVYEVLVPEGQVIEGEIADTTEVADIKPVTAAPGTVIEGVGVVTEEGVIVAEHLRPSAPRRNRPPPKKKGGPGRGKKRVTFTNPDGSTYTTIVPNATKIVPQPGQIVKHVAKGEEATADISVEEAAKRAQDNDGEDGEEGSGDDEDGDDDDDREEGELSDDDAPATGNHTPAKPDPVLPENGDDSQPMEDIKPSLAPEPALAVSPKTDAVPPPPAEEPPTESILPEENLPGDVSSSPEMPLATGHSRTGSLADPPPVSLDPAHDPGAVLRIPTEEPEVPPADANSTSRPPEPSEDTEMGVSEAVEAVQESEAQDNVASGDGDIPAQRDGVLAEETSAAHPPPAAAVEDTAVEPKEDSKTFDDGEEDLLGNLEKQLGQNSGKPDEDA